RKPLFLRAMFLKEAFLVLRESEDDETPQRAFFASEEAHREPAESVVYFRSGMVLHSLYQLSNKTYKKSLKYNQCNRSQEFKYTCSAHTATDTHGYNTILYVTSFHFMNQT